MNKSFKTIIISAMSFTLKSKDILLKFSLLNSVTCYIYKKKKIAFQNFSETDSVSEILAVEIASFLICFSFKVLTYCGIFDTILEPSS